MKSSILFLFAVVSIAAALTTSPARAGGGHDHGPQYGGVVREARDIRYELVAAPDNLTLYVSDHGKPVSTQGATADAVIYAGNDRIPVKLEPAGANRLSAKGKFKVGVGVRVAVNATLAGKPADRLTFKLR